MRKNCKSSAIKIKLLGPKSPNLHALCLKKEPLVNICLYKIFQYFLPFLSAFSVYPNTQKLSSDQYLNTFAVESFIVYCVRVLCVLMTKICKY